VAEILNRSGQYARTIEADAGPLYGIIDLVPTPGHTPSHHSLRFDCEGRSIVIAADAAMTRDFWNDRRGYFNSADFEQAKNSILFLERLADLVVPGHDNYFLNLRSDR
jgi:glyoxylase-like metal-dependent hydrolase (beta-lactamase superfamily II)